ncbi:UNVERIFIED_CONTAM: hypothetical protein FKN15_018082 [Acipenser sinensis]
MPPAILTYVATALRIIPAVTHSPMPQARQALLRRRPIFAIGLPPEVKKKVAGWRL